MLEQQIKDRPNNNRTGDPWPSDDEYREVIRLLDAARPVDCIKYVADQSGMTVGRAHAWVNGFITGKYAKLLSD